METERKYLSPDGRYGFDISPWEARMSHWIECGTLVEAATGRHVFGFTDSNWSLDRAEWLGPERVALTVRKYPGNHTPANFTIVLDCENRTASVDGVELDSFFSVEPHLDARVRKSPLKWLPG